MAVGDKIQLAFKSEVTAVNTNVTALNTTVNDPTTGLVTRVTNLEAGGGAGMTPQQVTDLADCVADKHTHANKTVLDLITAEFTVSEKTKLGNLTDNFKGLFADDAARNTAVPLPSIGNYVLQEDTNTVWYYNGTSWLNTGDTSIGDMTKAIYDPTSKNGDVFSMDNMVETATKKIMTDIERAKVAVFTDSVDNAVAMAAIPNPQEGQYCIRWDTKSVWIYVGGAWVDSAAGSGGPAVGDTKFSYKTADHDGWYILNGRSVSTLSSNAQAAAATLGWATIVPNTQGRYAIAASPTITSGTTGGSSFIARSVLPDVTLSGTTATGGSHSHSIPSLTVSGSTNTKAATSSTNKYVLSAGTAWTMDSEVGGDIAGTTRKYPAYASTSATSFFTDSSHSHTISGTTTSSTTTSNGSHNHSFTTSSINGGVTQTAHLPTYSAKTEFVFLGL